MLKGISPLIPPRLLKILCEMGHGDRIVLADANFPSESVGKNAEVVRLDGINMPELLDGILALFPLDTYVDKPVTLMEVVKGDKVETPIWKEYEDIISKHDERGKAVIGNIERFDFYDEAKKCYAIVATGEKALYANLILQKGVI